MVAIGNAPPVDVAEDVAELAALPAELVALARADEADALREEAWEAADEATLEAEELAELTTLEMDADNDDALEAAPEVADPTTPGRMVEVMVLPPEVMVVTVAPGMIVEVMVLPPEVMVVTMPKMVVLLSRVEVMVLPPEVMTVTSASVVTGTEEAPAPPPVPVEVAPGPPLWVENSVVVPTVEVIVLPPLVMVVTRTLVVTGTTERPVDAAVPEPAGPTAVPLAVRAEVAAKELLPETEAQ